MTPTRASSRLRVTGAYLVALAVAIGVVAGLPDLHPVAVAACADLAATVVVFGFSVAWRNASVYDPYWSVAPPIIAVYWAATGFATTESALRSLLVLMLVTAWAVRLTANWVQRWRGLDDEDWRYVDLRRRHGRRFGSVNFWGIHLLPTVLVFLGCLPLYPALADPTRAFGWIDALAAAATLAAIVLEARADAQLRRFRAHSDAGATLDSGLWARFKHPNYLGEMLFWWGLFGLGMAANPDYWWTALGALAITALFVFVSIPMMDARLRRNGPGR